MFKWIASLVPVEVRFFHGFSSIFGCIFDDFDV